MGSICFYAQIAAPPSIYHMVARSIGDTKTRLSALYACRDNALKYLKDP